MSKLQRYLHWIVIPRHSKLIASVLGGLATAVALWLLSQTASVVYAALVDWPTIGWNDTAPAGPGTQSFSDLGATGININVSYSGNMWGNNSVPQIYGALAPVSPLQRSLRWTNNTADTGGLPGAADGPSTVEVVFSAPVYLDQLTVGGLSALGSTSYRYEWAELRAYDINDQLVPATAVDTSTYVVNSSGALVTVATPGSTMVSDDGAGVYRARGTSIQANCDRGCGYDSASYAFTNIPVTRIEVIQFVTTGPTATSARSDLQSAIVFEDIDFRPATPMVVPSDPETAAIGNCIWLDENADGYQDAGEPGIPGVIVNLTDSDGDVAQTVSDAQGCYRFDQLPAATYTVTLPAANQNPGAPLAGLTQTQNPVLPNADFGNQTLPYAVTVGIAAENLTADFGFNRNPDAVNSSRNSGSIGDRVWVDEDGDGAQDPNEVGLENVTVNLIDPGSDDLLGTDDDIAIPQITDATGRYRFDDLPPGAYRLVVDATTLPAGYLQTGDPDHFGTTGTNDGQTTTPIILAPGDLFLNADFGYTPDTAVTGRIGSTIWFDANASASAKTTPLPADEPGLAGVTVTLLRADLGLCNPESGQNSVLATAVTDASGSYVFAGLPLDDGDGDYPYMVWVNDSANVLAGLTPTYDFDGTGTANCSLTTLSAAATQDVAQDFSYTPRNHDPGDGLIGNTVWLNRNGNAVQDADEPGLEGVVVTLTDATLVITTTTTDENGRYFFGNLDPNHSYTVAVAASNFDPGGVLAGLANTADPDGTTDSQSVVDLSATGPRDVAQDFGYTPDPANVACIGNLLWRDANGNGTYEGDSGLDSLLATSDDETALANVTIDLYRDLNGSGTVDPDEPRWDTAVTSASASANGCFTPGDLGNYIFTDLPPGSFVVNVSDRAGVLLGQSHTTGGAALTDESQSDPYALTVASNSDNLTADFGYYLSASALGNRVWEDSNDNGRQDAGEPGLPGVRVTLTIDYPGGVQTVVHTLSDDSGAYSFANVLLDENDGDGLVPEPTFTISAALPPGYRSAPIDINGNTEDKQDADDPAGVTAVARQGVTDTALQVDPTSEQEIASYDFGFVPQVSLQLAALGNRVWLDENSDGRQDPGEPGIANVTVTLADASGGMTRTQTDTHGGYLFPALPPGVYTITLDTATLPAGLLQTASPVLPLADFGNQTLPYSVLLTPNAENLTADFGFIWNPTGVNSNDGVAMIGDRVWLDDGNGRQDPSEMGIANVLLNLLTPGPDNQLGTADDVVAATTTTDSNGRYGFINLDPGLYQVAVDASNFSGVNPLVAMTQTGDPDQFGQVATSPDNLTSVPIVLSPGDAFINADFGYRPQQCGQIGDTIWLDADASATAVVDAGEVGMGGVTVALVLDLNGNGLWDVAEPVVATAVTDAAGEYRFACLSLDDGDGDADYLVWVNDTDSVLAGLTPTYDDKVASDGLDNLSTAALSAGSPTDLDQDFSYTPIDHVNGVGLIGDTVYHDANGDGAQQPGEPGIEGVLVTLQFPNSSTVQTLTDENGRYAFGNLPLDQTYTVIVDSTGVLAGTTNTADPDTPLAPDAQAVVTLTAGALIDLNQDFGYTAVGPDAAQLGNLVWLDSNADGVFDGVDGSDGLPNTDDDEPVLGGVTLALYRDSNGNGVLDAAEPRVATAVTAATLQPGLGSNANYLFSGLAAGDYIVHVSDVDGVLLGHWHTLGTPSTDGNSQLNPYAVTLTAGDDRVTADFGYQQEPAAIGNRIWQDLAGNGVQDMVDPALPGAVVTLTITFPNSATVHLTTLSALDGSYSFGNLLLDEDYGGATLPTHTLAVSPGGNLVPTQTDVGDDRTDSDDPLATAVTPLKGRTDTTLLAAPANEGGNASYDFGFHQPLQVGNLVFNDLNNDGKLTPASTEAGIPGVLVELIDPMGNPVLDITTGQPITDVTDVDGFYLLENVPSGNFVVRVAASNFDEWDDPLYGFYSSRSDITPDPATNPDDGVDNDDNGRINLDPAVGGVQTAVFTLEFNSEPTTEDGDANTNLTVDFGFFELLTVGNTVWHDLNEDGRIDSGEPGVPNVVVDLLDGSGNPVLHPVTSQPLRTTTDAAGQFQFTNLYPGDYQIQIAAINFRASGALEGFISTPGSADPDNDDNSDDNGVDSDTPDIGGITSLPVTLAYRLEPSRGLDGDDNSNTNLSVDFGMIPVGNPIELLSFTATAVGGFDVQLDWETAVELDNLGFNLYRSRSSNFATAELVTFVLSSASNGSGAVYSYTDTVPEQGEWYYWLEDVDIDGKQTLHPPVTVIVPGGYGIYLPLIVSP